MKKLMIALAAVACAAGVQAASVSWQSHTGSAATYLVDATDKTTKLTGVPDGGSIVLIKLVAADLASFTAGTWSGAKDAYTVLDTASVGSGKGSGKVTGTYSFDYGSKVINDGDYLAAVLKTSDGAFTQLTYTDDSKVANYMTVAGMATAEGKGEQALWSQNFDYATAGNFTAAAVPEPTSGLLLLLGVAGMALRRRRA